MPDNRPSPRFRSHSDRPLDGVRRVIQVPAPAVITDQQLVVPGGRVWRILSAFLQLATSGNAGTRTFAYRIDVDGFEILHAGQTASMNVVTETYDLSMAVDVAVEQNAAQTFPQVVPLPLFWLPGGAVFRTTMGFIAGDQLSAMNVWIEERYEDDVSIEQERQHQLEAIADAIEHVKQATGG